MKSEHFELPVDWHQSRDDPSVRAIPCCYYVIPDFDTVELINKNVFDNPMLSKKLLLEEVIKTLQAQIEETKKSILDLK